MMVVNGLFSSFTSTGLLLLLNRIKPMFSKDNRRGKLLFFSLYSTVFFFSGVFTCHSMWQAQVSDQGKKLKFEHPELFKQFEDEESAYFESRRL